MSAYNPPSFIVSVYNPYFFTSTNTGSLTQSQANGLYLQKTVADTATAVETFGSGIVTNSLSTTTATSDLLIYPAQTSGNIYLGVPASSATGRTGTIHIGDGNNMPAGATIHINNGTSNACNTNIMNGSTTSGTCNIMTGATSSGSVNIASGSGSSTVSISSGTTTGTLTLGNSANTVNVNGSLTMGTGKNITLQDTTTSYTAPTADTMLGGITVGSFTTPASSFSGNKEVATISLVKGTYMVFFSFQANYTVLPTANYITLLGTALPLPTIIVGASTLATGAIGFTGSFPISVTTAGTVTLNYNITGTINTLSINFYKAVRIA